MLGKWLGKWISSIEKDKMDNCLAVSLFHILSFVLFRVWPCVFYCLGLIQVTSSSV